jgi:hypothetical protein
LRLIITARDFVGTPRRDRDGWRKKEKEKAADDIVISEEIADME